MVCIWGGIAIFGIFCVFELDIVLTSGKGLGNCEFLGFRGLYLFIWLFGSYFGIVVGIIGGGGDGWRENEWGINLFCFS